MNSVEESDELFNAELRQVAGEHQDPHLSLYLLPDPTKTRVKLL
jgi:hypothetical protein